MSARNSQLLLSQTHQLENCQQIGQKNQPLSKQLAWTLQNFQDTNQDKDRGKSMYLLFPSSLHRTGHLKLLPNRTAEEFIKHLNWFLTRKGHPRKIYSYNGQTFSAAVKQLNGVVKHVLFIRFSQSRMFHWIQRNVKLDVSNKSDKVS